MRLLVFTNLAPYQLYPTAVKPIFWDDIDPVVGVWRYPNSTFNHKSSCFNVTCRTNSYGAMDQERSLGFDAPRRVVVLGDSYVEGFGVEEENRFTNLLEHKTGIEHLNFGISGSFGTIQEWLLYENSASKFDHTDVMLFILPANDFSDNNPNDFPAQRFRPYLRRDAANNFEIFYTVDFNSRKREFRDWGLIVKNSIDNTSYLANFLRFANREIKKTLKDETKTVPKIKVPYNNYTREEMDIMLHCLKKITYLAQDRNFFIFTIPGYEDFSWAQQHGYDFEIVRELNNLAENYQNVRYTDLLPGFLSFAEKNAKNYNDFTHSCDGHWNNLGHLLASEIIEKQHFADGR